MAGKHSNRNGQC